MSRTVTMGGRLLGFILLLFLVTPLLYLAVSMTPGEMIEGLTSPLVVPALLLTAKTTAITLLLTIFLGTPLAWFLARTKHPVLETLVELPIVVPPAVVGIALLVTFGERGPMPWSVAFSTTAVVMAQLIVSAPYYVRSAIIGFAKVDEDLLLVARTLGASESTAFFRVAVPSAWGALAGGAALSWARAAGEFGATLLFAGNMMGRTQTMPLAIYTALESSVTAAQSIAFVLAASAFVLLIGVRLWIERKS